MQVKQSGGSGLPQRVPDFVQSTPRHITMGFLATKPTTSSPGTSVSITSSKKRILALAPESSRLHAIVGRVELEASHPVGEEQRMRHLEYHVFNLNGKTVSSRRLPALSRQIGGSWNSPEASGIKNSYYSDITLTSPAEVCP